MSWKDRLLLKLMGSKMVLRIMSIPVVVKMLTTMTQAFSCVASLFNRKKKE